METYFCNNRTEKLTYSGCECNGNSQSDNCMKIKLNTEKKSHHPSWLKIAQKKSIIQEHQISFFLFEHVTNFTAKSCIDLQNGNKV